MPFVMPRNLTAAAEQQGRRAWLASLPTTIAALQERWDLVDVDDPFQPGGQTAWVAAAQSAAKGTVVLKVAWRHTESAHEAAGLRVWNGAGAVRLHEVHESGDTVAMLIEQCVPGSTLTKRSEPEQDSVIASLLQRLWKAPTGQPFRPLQAMCDAWADEFDEKAAMGTSTLDPGIAREGISLFRSLPATAERTVLLCTDLHAGNVLAAQREPWLVIDPKPHAGDPAYDALQHMLNCDRRLHEEPRDLAHRMADLLDLDRDRVVLWLFARCVQESPDWQGLADVARRVAP